MQSLENLLDALTKRAVVLWDFDGVIANTEPRQMSAFIQVLDRRGYQVSLAEMRQYVGMREAEIWRDLMQHYALSDSAEAMSEERSRTYLDLCRDLEPAWYVLPILSELQRCGRPSWIVSSGRYRHVGRLLAHMDISDMFERVLCENSPDRPKLASKALRLQGARDIWGDDAGYIEDRADYLQFGTANGWTVVAVSHSLNELNSADWPFTLSM